MTSSNPVKLAEQMKVHGLSMSSIVLQQVLIQLLPFQEVLGSYS